MATKPKKIMFKWETAYTDLPEAIATTLRERRLKPDQVASMTDGELLSLEGLNDESVAIIREKYPSELTPLVESKAAPTPTAEVEVPKPASLSPRLRHPRHLHGRSKRYRLHAAKVENPAYTVEDALALLRQVAYSKHKTIELHLNTKEEAVRGELALPHSIGKQIRVAIYSPEVAKAIAGGKIDFDILLATPADMAQIAPLAKVLGPRGLMPNPKTGTITTDPEARAKQLTAGATLAYKTEPKSKTIHLNVGNLNQKDTEITDNLKAILTGIGVNKLTTVYLKSTMSPAIKLDLASL